MPWCMVLDPQVPQGYFCLWMDAKLVLKGGYNEECFIQGMALGTRLTAEAFLTGKDKTE